MESHTVNGLNRKAPDAYKPPEADPSENQAPSIGGWLRFFQVMSYLGLISSALAILAFPVMHLFVEGVVDRLVDLVALIFELSPGLIFSFLIVRALPVREPDIPARLKSLLGYYLGITLLFYVILTAAFKTGHLTDKPSPFIGDIVYYAIWASYFNKSKRVRAYYGANAK